MTTSTTTSGLADFRGTVLHPHDAGYDDVRRVWNGSVNRRPALIARAICTADVASAITFAVRHDLPIAVRGGGHSIPGHSVCDGGVMVDLSLMREVTVDPERRLAQVQPGVLLAEYDAATQAHGLASPGGEISHTGVAGLTLGGGVGWLSRMHGLACDNLVEAEVVTATGEVVVASDETNADLMWGLRGGGGNFGVVTRFTFRLHPVQPMLAGAVMVPATQAKQAIAVYRDLCAQAPDELSLSLACVTAPPAPFVPEHLHFQPVVAVGAAWVGRPEDGWPWVEKLRSLRPAVDMLGVMPYVALQSMVDAGAPHGRAYHVKSEWLDDLDDGALDDLVAAATTPSSPYNQVLLRQLGGATARIDRHATACTFRDAKHLLTVVGAWEPGADGVPHVAWAHDVWSRLCRVSSGGGYVNQLDADEGTDRTRDAYGARTWDRLTELKARWDPDNAFRLNANVPPARP